VALGLFAALVLEVVKRYLWAGASHDGRIEPIPSEHSSAPMRYGSLLTVVWSSRSPLAGA